MCSTMTSLAVWNSPRLNNGEHSDHDHDYEGHDHDYNMMIMIMIII